MLGGTMARNVYPAEVRERAVSLCVEHGPAEAARRLAADGITIQAGTIRSWASREGVATVAAQKMGEAREAAKARREIDRLELAHDTFAYACVALQRVGEALETGDHVASRGFVVTFGTLVDKVNVLIGKPDDDQAGDDIAEIEALIDELAAHRQARAA